MSYYDIGLLCLTEIVGDFGYKEFANKGGITNFSIGTIGYIGVIYTLIRSLQGSQVLLVNAAWDGLSALIESIAAIVILGERFDDPWKYFGIFLIVVGLFFLRMPVVNEKKFIFPKLFKETFISK
jgi:multidrug transporter EmrE-like cation transporter